MPPVRFDWFAIYQFAMSCQWHLSNQPSTPLKIVRLRYTQKTIEEDSGDIGGTLHYSTRIDGILWFVFEKDFTMHKSLIIKSAAINGAVFEVKVLLENAPLVIETGFTSNFAAEGKDGRKAWIEEFGSHEDYLLLRDDIRQWMAESLSVDIDLIIHAVSEYRLAQEAVRNR